MCLRTLQAPAGPMAEAPSAKALAGRGRPRRRGGLWGIVAKPERMVARTHARLSAFGRGVVWGLQVAGWSTRAIMKVVRKTDGTAPTQQAVAGAIANGKKNGGP